MAQHFQNVSIILPTIDEEAIGQVIGSIYTSCDPADLCEFIVIYSPRSSTAYIASLNALSALCPQTPIRVMLQEYDGLGGAFYTGFAHANGSHVIPLAADMENDPGMVPKMICLAKQNPDYVINTSRWLDGAGFVAYPVWKKALNYIGQIYLRLFFHSKQTDITCPFACMPLQYFREHSFLPKHDAFLLELGLLSDVDHRPLIELPTTLGKRSSGKTHMYVRYYFGFLSASLKVWLSSKKR